MSLGKPPLGVEKPSVSKKQTVFFSPDQLTSCVFFLYF